MTHVKLRLDGCRLKSNSTLSGLQLPSPRNYRVRSLFLGSLYHGTSSIAMILKVVADWNAAQV
jgi:hypothetical protein